MFSKHNARILMVVGDYVEDYEAMVPKQILDCAGHTVVTVCPDKSDGDTVATAVHDFDGDQTYSEKPGHRFAITGDFDSVSVDAFDALVIPGGRAPEYLRLNPAVVKLVAAFDAAKKPIAAICHGVQLLAAAGVIRDRHISCYPACRFEVDAGGGIYVDAADTMDNAHTDGHLVTAPAWPAHPQWMRQFLQLIESSVSPDASNDAS